MQNQTRRHEAIDDKITVDLQIHFYVLIVGVEVEFRLDIHLSNGLPYVFHTHGRTDIMLRALVFVQTEILGINPHGVHDMNNLIGHRRDGDTQSLHGLVVDTESGVESERRERRGLEFHRVGFISRQEPCLELR